jgi:hypothetical protein
MERSKVFLLLFFLLASSASQISAQVSLHIQTDTSVYYEYSMIELRSELTNSGPGDVEILNLEELTTPTVSIRNQNGVLLNRMILHVCGPRSYIRSGRTRAERADLSIFGDRRLSIFERHIPPGTYTIAARILYRPVDDEEKRSEVDAVATFRVLPISPAVESLLDTIAKVLSGDWKEVFPQLAGLYETAPSKVQPRLLRMMYDYFTYCTWKLGEKQYAILDCICKCDEEPRVVFEILCNFQKHTLRAYAVDRRLPSIDDTASCKECMLRLPLTKTLREYIEKLPGKTAR